jgi:hypothetical protein
LAPVFQGYFILTGRIGQTRVAVSLQPGGIVAGEIPGAGLIFERFSFRIKSGLALVGH